MDNSPLLQFLDHSLFDKAVDRVDRVGLPPAAKGGNVGEDHGGFVFFNDQPLEINKGLQVKQQLLLSGRKETLAPRMLVRGPQYLDE